MLLPSVAIDIQSLCNIIKSMNKIEITEQQKANIISESKNLTITDRQRAINVGLKRFVIEKIKLIKGGFIKKIPCMRKNIKSVIPCNSNLI